MLYVFFILLFFIIILLIPFRLRFRLFFDPFKNRLFILVTLFSVINVLTGYITLKKGKLYIVGKNNKASLLIDKGDNKALQALQKSTFKILKNATYTKMNIFIEVSTKEDIALNIFSRTLCRIFLDVISNYAISHNENIRIKKYIIEKQGINNFQLSIDSMLHLKIYKVIYIYIYNLFKNFNKEVKKQ